MKTWPSPACHFFCASWNLFLMFGLDDARIPIQSRRFSDTFSLTNEDTHRNLVWVWFTHVENDYFFSFYFTWSVVQVIKNFIALSANSLWMVKRNFLQVYKMPECFSQWVLLWVWRAVSLYVYVRVYIHGLHLWAIIVLWCITNQQKRANINCRFRFFCRKKNS